MARKLGRQAVVIGGSVAGLMTARVLADHFDQVTILERDQIEERPAGRKSIPQGNHIHLLLLGGQQVMSSLYPDFTDRMDQLGAVRFRAGIEAAYHFPDGRAYNVLGTVRRPYDLGFDVFCQSRGLLEHCVRQCTLALSNVSLESGCSVQSLIYEDARVQGVRCDYPDGPDTFDADLVVDAGGRGSRAPRWLKDLGFQAPDETTIGVDFAYSSTKFRIPDSYDEPERLLSFIGPAPDYPEGALMEEIEERTWHLTLFGRFGEYPPADEEGFYAFAQALHTPKLYELIKDAERVAEIVQYKYPVSVLRHYEQLTAFPDGFLLLGDALCSFNPIYGQGMSSAALQVRELQQELTERAAGSGGLEGLALAFFPKAAEAVTTPWTLAANADFAYPMTKGERPANEKEDHAYFGALIGLTAEDMEVYKLVTEVFQLAKPLSALREEPLRSRVECLMKIN